MKRILPVVLALMVLLTGCGPSEPPYSDPSYTVDTLPYDMDYNGTKIPIKSVEIYQDKVNYEWSPYLVIHFDITDVSDDQLHWLTTVDWSSLEADLDIDATYSSAQNELKYSHFSLMKKYYNRDEQDLAFLYLGYLDKGRKDFSDIVGDVDIKLRQDETYTDSSKKEKHKFNYYNIDINRGTEISIERSVRPTDDLSDMEENMYIKGFEEEMEKYK